MSAYSDLQKAFVEGQRLVAQATGAPVANKNALIGGTGYCGVWGQPQAVEVMRAGGGYSRRMQITWTATRGQFATAPDSKLQIVRIDVTPNETYRVDVVTTDDPLHYVLTCVKVG